MTQEYPASPVSSASQSLCLDLDAISSEDSDANPGDAHSTSPITVISVDSSDSDPDSSEVHSSTGSPSVPGSPTSSGASVCVVESPSHYPTPDEPVMLSAASSMLISPNRVLEDCVSVTAEIRDVSGLRGVSEYYGMCNDVSACTTFIAYGILASSGSGVFSSRGSSLLGWFGSRVSVAPYTGRYGACAGVGS